VDDERTTVQKEKKGERVEMGIGNAITKGTVVRGKWLKPFEGLISTINDDWIMLYVCIYERSSHISKSQWSNQVWFGNDEEKRRKEWRYTRSRSAKKERKWTSEGPLVEERKR
jgi:hypothetical protein